MSDSSLNIDNILIQISNNQNVSDIHIASGSRISFRLNWEIKKIDKFPELTEEMVEYMLRQLMKGNQKMYEEFASNKEADFSYIANDGTPFRVNAFFKLWKIWIVLRKINSEALPLEKLVFQDVAENLKKNVLSKKHWLFLVTWPTWSGKSTSLIAMLEHINQNRPDHIITIEDPIEFVFKEKKSIVSQREIWHDTWHFMNALRAAMREDPDVVLVWEIRDKETAEAVLNLAETWHLVFSTLHTSSASGTINRFISFFPPAIQDSIADRLAEILAGVKSQRLMKTSDWRWRVGMYEIMINTSAVRNNIKKRQLAQVDNIIETWMKQWMYTLQQYAQRLIQEGFITEEAVSWLFKTKSSG